MRVTLKATSSLLLSLAVASEVRDRPAAHPTPSTYGWDQAQSCSTTFPLPAERTYHGLNGTAVNELAPVTPSHSGDGPALQETSHDSAVLINTIVLPDASEGLPANAHCVAGKPSSDSHTLTSHFAFDSEGFAITGSGQAPLATVPPGTKPSWAKDTIRAIVAFGEHCSTSFHR